MPDFTGTGTATAPPNTVAAIFELVGPGGGGQRRADTVPVGGDGGGYCKKGSVAAPVLCAPGDTIAYAQGTPGVGRTGSTGAGTNATAATFGSGTGLLASVTMSSGIAQGGNSSGRTAPTGGDVNTQGANGSNAKGGDGAPPLGAAGGASGTSAVAGSDPGGGGGAGYSNTNGKDGGAGLVRITWILAAPNKYRAVRQAVKRGAYF